MCVHPNIGNSMRLCDPRTSALAAMLLVGGLFACGGESEPPVPQTITVAPTSITFHAIGETEQLTTTITDQRGDPLPDAAVTWTSTDQAVAMVSPTGLVTAQGAGQAQVSAAAGEVTAIAQVSVTPVPAEVKPISGNAQTGIVDQALPLPLIVQVEDALDHPISGVPVTFAVTQGGGGVQPATATTGADGRASATFTLGSTAGAAQQVTAAVTGTALSIAFTATAVEPTPGITAAAGNGQSAPNGQAVPVAPAVRVLDAQGDPIEGVPVSFQVTGGGGSISGGETVTDATGIATVVSWTVGAGGINTMTATADEPGLDGNPVTFVATTDATTGFNIKIRFQGTPSADQLLAFATAELRWEQLVTGDLADVAIEVPATDCSPAVDETVDDLIIYATLQPIDGPGSVLGAAGPCYIRTTGELSIIGRMFFDTEDLQLIENNNLLDEVILHEMGHVLGFGTLWEDHELLADKSLTEPPGVDPHFTGAQAITAFDAAGGNTYVGLKVPVENTGGAGTADSHWRETVFGSELMTGFVDLGVNPLSRISIASLADMGYVVNLAAADAYTLSPGLRVAGSRHRLQLKNDIIRGPIRRVDASGRIVGVLSR